MNQGPPKYEAWILTTLPQRSTSMNNTLTFLYGCEDMLLRVVDLFSYEVFKYHSRFQIPSRATQKYQRKQFIESINNCRY
jgi:hypothetical protein